MKTFLTTTVLTLFFSMHGFSQDAPRKQRAEREPLSLEQRNQLQLKKMTLELDLTASQQKEMAALLAETSAKREAKKAERLTQQDAKKELSADEKFALRNKMLDEQIAYKAKMKKILTEKQFEKWEASTQKRQHAMRKMKRTHPSKNQPQSE
ncbi:hypothetical protein [Flavobacterium luminosum]|uniref:DUF4890 domain-containing protein n=1 Tax=Flavobacterium luminosum TaxID=2949086 RepID=A0ABT0TKI3_9FLAO|nr:hypothetical protein [Flavobacterium sp. HXWNR70]MCL9807910.1 hypothetical protein [Flavobacterium sp. HXWNR70]